MHILMLTCLFSADVKSELDDLSKMMKNFEARVGFAKDLESMSLVRATPQVVAQLRYCVRHKWGHMY